ncbi:MAG: hypothetical protein H0X64_05810, partial [Gemmatimonadaceae bacterium]|nr:hypothetical protein [Gemmatimonadaceae bacterium]
HRLVATDSRYEAMHEPESNILCFRHVGNGTMDAQALDAHNLALRERYNRSGHGWITTTVLDGRRVLRVTLMNWRTTGADCEAMLEGIASA